MREGWARGVWNGMRGALRSRFAQDAGKLTLASVAAQAVFFGAFVLMASACGDADVGVYSVFAGYGAIVGVVNLLSYQWVVAHKTRGEGLAALMLLLLGLTLVSSLVVGFGFWLAGYGFWLELGVFVGGRSLVMICEQVSIREERYGPLMLAKLSVALMFLGGLVWWVYGGGGGGGAAGWLVWCHALAYGVVGLGYGILVLPSQMEGVGGVGWRDVVQMAVEERNFSLYVMPSQLFNMMSYHVPTILLEWGLGAGSAGQYALTLRLCNTPLGMVSGALGQAWHGKLAAVQRSGVKPGVGGYKKLVALLGVGAFFVVVGAFWVLPELVPMVVGEGWEEACGLVRVMAPLYGAIWMTGPLSVAFFVFEEQLFLFWNQLVYVVISLVGFGLAVWWEDLWLGVVVFTALSMVRYAVIYWKLHRVHMHELQAPAPSLRGRVSDL